MKLRRKTALWAAIVCVFTAVCAVGCGKAAKEEKNTILVTDAEVKAGEEVTVYVRATDEIPAAAYGIEVSYNPEELTFKECDKTDAFMKAWTGLDISNDTETDNGKTVMIAGVNVNADEEKYKGDMYYITFTATGKKGTKAELSMRVSALEDIDQKNHIDEYNVKGGTIKIK